MASRNQRSAAPARPAPARPAHVGRRQAAQLGAQLAASGLSHQEQRRLRAVLRAREDATRRRLRLLKRLSIAVTGGIVALAIATLSFGLVPAIEAALGTGATGTFDVGQRVCSSRTGCQWVGTFQSSRGVVVSGLAYAGSLPPGDGPGSSVPARYPGGSDQVYALRGSHTWVIDLLGTLAISAAVGAALWISPLGAGSRDPKGVRK